MVEPKQMQEPVHDEMLQMMQGRDALLRRLAADGLGRQHDVPQVARLRRLASLSVSSDRTATAGAWNGNDSTLVGASLPR